MVINIVLYCVDYGVYVWFFKEVIGVFDFIMGDSDIFLFVKFVYEVYSVLWWCNVVGGVVDD